MKHTKEQLEGMSDFDINVMISDLLGIKWSCAPQNSPNGNWLFTNKYKDISGDSTPLADYCNNPSDMMPLVFDSKISLEFIDGFGWTADDCDALPPVSCYDKPLRAAAIVYLMMQGETNEG